MSQSRTFKPSYDLLTKGKDLLTKGKDLLTKGKELAEKFSRVRAAWTKIFLFLELSLTI